MNAPAEKRKAGLLTREQYEIILRARRQVERWQLIDAIAVVIPPPILRHQMIGGNLDALLRHALERNRPELGVLFESGLA